MGNVISTIVFATSVAEAPLLIDCNISWEKGFILEGSSYEFGDCVCKFDDVEVLGLTFKLGLGEGVEVVVDVVVLRPVPKLEEVWTGSLELLEEIEDPPLAVNVEEVSGLVPGFEVQVDEDSRFLKKSKSFLNIAFAIWGAIPNPTPTKGKVYKSL